MKKKVKVFGYGEMGKKHVMALSKRDHIECEFYDTYLHEDGNDFYNFDYAIIATPIINHYAVYKHIRERFDGPILIEKPAVIYRNHFDIFDDPKVFVGVIERYNPVTKRLKELLQGEEIVSLEFTRVFETCRGEAYFELAIHDLDLMVYLLNLAPDTKFEQLSLSSRNRIYTSQIKHSSLYSVFSKKLPMCLFSWGESSSNHRKIHVVCGNKSIKAHLDEKRIVTIQAGDVQRETFEDDALMAEHTDFLMGKYPDTRLSHDLLLRLMYV